MERHDARGGGESGGKRAGRKRRGLRPVAIGELEVTATGTQRLVIDPVNKLKSAVLDVQKVVLTPAG